MSQKVLHKRSSAVVNGQPKLPTPEQMEYGEIAINFAKGYETFSILNTESGITTLEDVDNAVISYLGSGFTIPTKNQFEELLNNTTQTWDSINSGIVFTSIINGKTLFLPAAGCGINGQQQHTGSSGFYWSSTLGTDNKSCAYRFYIPINEYSIYESVRSSGWSIRPVVTPNI